MSRSVRLFRKKPTSQIRLRRVGEWTVYGAHSAVPYSSSICASGSRVIRSFALRLTAITLLTHLDCARLDSLHFGQILMNELHHNRAFADT